MDKMSYGHSEQDQMSAQRVTLGCEWMEECPFIGR